MEAGARAREYWKEEGWGLGGEHRIMGREGGIGGTNGVML
jgi:hypothetical protein